MSIPIPEGKAMDGPFPAWNLPLPKKPKPGIPQVQGQPTDSTRHSKHPVFLWDGIAENPGMVWDFKADPIPPRP